MIVASPKKLKIGAIVTLGVMQKGTVKETGEKILSSTVIQQPFCIVREATKDEWLDFMAEDNNISVDKARHQMGRIPAGITFYEVSTD